MKNNLPGEPPPARAPSTQPTSVDLEDGGPIATVEALVAELEKDDYHSELVFSGLSFAGYDLADHTFEDCVFDSCHFRDLSLSRVGFVSCAFSRCEFILVKLEHAMFNSARFRDSKLVGLNFSDCSKFGFLPDYESCLLDGVTFCGNSLKKGRFFACTIRDSDFLDCDLRETSFDGTSLESTSFQKCNLERADFRSARDYSIDPVNNRLSRARFSLPEAQSFLGFLGISIE